MQILNSDDLKLLLLDMISTKRPLDPERLVALTNEDWSALSSYAEQHRLGPLLHHRRRQTEQIWSVPERVCNEWAAAYRQAALRALSVRRTLATICPLLEGAGIQYAALKGAWLLDYAYPHPALRPVRDIDIIVAPGSALLAFGLLERHGFVRPDEHIMPPEDEIELRKHLPPLNCVLTGISVEIHTRLTTVRSERSESETLANVGHVLARSERHDGIMYLTPTDTLMHLIVHSVYDHRFDNGPLIFNDIAHLLENWSIDWSRFWRMAHEGGWLHGCLLVLAITSRYHHTEVVRDQSGLSPEPSAQHLQSAALLSLQDFGQRKALGIRVRLDHAPSRFEKMKALVSRAFPTLHVLATFSGARTASRWALLHYPRWLLYRIKQVLAAQADIERRSDVERTAMIRQWIETGAS